MKGLRIKTKKKLNFEYRIIKKRNETLKIKKYNISFIKNFVPKFPNIFYISHDDLDLRKVLIENIDEILNKEEFKNNYMLEKLKEGKNLYEDFIQHINLNNKNSTLWKISNNSPSEISDFITRSKNMSEEDKINSWKENKEVLIEIYEIIDKYSSNYFIYKNINENIYTYIYFSKGGLRYVDSYLYSKIIKIEENYKQIAYDSSMFSQLCEKILKGIKDREILNKELNNISLFKFITEIGEKYLKVNLLPQTLKVIMTEILQENNKVSEKKHINSNTTVDINNIKWVKLSMDKKTLCVLLGKRFLQIVTKFIIYEEKRTSKSKTKNINDLLKTNTKNHKNLIISRILKIMDIIIDKVKDHDLLEKYLKIDFKEESYDNKYLFNKQIYLSYLLENLNTNKYINKSQEISSLEDLLIEILTPKKTKKNIKNTQLYKLIRQTPSEMGNYKDLFLIYYGYINSNTLDKTTQIYPALEKILKLYIGPKIVIYELEMGEFLFKLCSDMLFYTDKPEDVYMNGEYYYSTIQPQILPSFGPYKINLEMLQKKTKKMFINHRIILESYIKQDEIDIRRSPKFKSDNSVISNIEDQLQYGNTLFARLELNIIQSFISNLLKLFSMSDKEFENKCDQNWSFFKYFIPKSTNLIQIKNQYNSEDFVDLMRVLTNVKTKEQFYNKNIFINSNLRFHGFTKLLEANSTIKFELKRLLLPLLFYISFSGWYPKTWMDARGRQYPNESMLNNTKSVKFRTLAYYVTSHTIEKSFWESLSHQIDKLDNLKNIWERMLNSELDQYKKKDKIYDKNFIAEIGKNEQMAINNSSNKQLSKRKRRRERKKEEKRIKRKNGT